jgi:hypothetical protein
LPPLILRHCAGSLHSFHRCFAVTLHYFRQPFRRAPGA